MELILSLAILALLIVLFIREIKSTKQVDLFVSFVVAGVAIGASLFAWIDVGFKFSILAHYVYIVVLVVAIIYLIYFLIKYFKNKDKKEEEKND